MHPKIIFVEGNIGAGKSTFLDALRNHIEHLRPAASHSRPEAPLLPANLPLRPQESLAPASVQNGEHKDLMRLVPEHAPASIQNGVSEELFDKIKSICVDGRYKRKYEMHLPPNNIPSSSYTVFLKEPVDIWESIADAFGKTILEKMYEDPAKYASIFQFLAFQTLEKQFMEALENPFTELIVCERSLQSTWHVFAKMMHDDGYMNDIEYAVYERMCKKSDVMYIEPDLVVYLDVDVNTCFERVKKRNRRGEENITLEYLSRCEKYHKEMMHSGLVNIEKLITIS